MSNTNKKMTLRELALSRENCKFKLETNTNSIYKIEDGHVSEVSGDDDKYPDGHFIHHPIVDMLYLKANLDTYIEKLTTTK